MDGTDFDDHVVICGWTNIGKVALDELMATQQKTVVITDDEDEITKVRDAEDEKYLYPVFGDYKNEKELKRANVTSSFTLEAEGMKFLLSLEIQKDFRNRVRLPTEPLTPCTSPEVAFRSPTFYFTQTQRSGRRFQLKRPRHNTLSIHDRPLPAKAVFPRLSAGPCLEPLPRTYGSEYLSVHQGGE